MVLVKYKPINLDQYIEYIYELSSLNKDHSYVKPEDVSKLLPELIEEDGEPYWNSGKDLSRLTYRDEWEAYRIHESETHDIVRTLRQRSFSATGDIYREKARLHLEEELNRINEMAKQTALLKRQQSERLAVLDAQLPLLEEIAMLIEEEKECGPHFFVKEAPIPYLALCTSPTSNPLYWIKIHDEGTDGVALYNAAIEGRKEGTKQVAMFFSATYASLGTRGSEFILYHIAEDNTLTPSDSYKFVMHHLKQLRKGT